MTMTNNYPAERKSPVRLTDDDEYAVYKHCIENHGVYQKEDSTEFRVEPNKLANEINLLSRSIISEGKKINSHHVKTSVERVVAWQKRLGKLPVVPLETAELEQLRIFKINATRDIENMKIGVEELKKEREYLIKKIAHLEKSDALSKLDRIRAIVSVN